jgi:hypothetical protein
MLEPNSNLNYHFNLPSGKLENHLHFDPAKEKGNTKLEPDGERLEFCRQRERGGRV